MSVDSILNHCVRILGQSVPVLGLKEHASLNMLTFFVMQLDRQTVFKHGVERFSVEFTSFLRFTLYRFFATSEHKQKKPIDKFEDILHCLEAVCYIKHEEQNNRFLSYIVQNVGMCFTSGILTHVKPFLIFIQELLENEDILILPNKINGIEHSKKALLTLVRCTQDDPMLIEPPPIYTRLDYYEIEDMIRLFRLEDVFRVHKNSRDIAMYLFNYDLSYVRGKPLKELVKEYRKQVDLECANLCQFDTSVCTYSLARAEADCEYKIGLLLKKVMTIREFLIICMIDFVNNEKQKISLGNKDFEDLVKIYRCINQCTKNMIEVKKRTNIDELSYFKVQV